MSKPINGFTYIEFVIAIVILAILYFTFSPGLILTSTFNLNSITKQVKEDIQYAQILSLMAGNSQGGSTGNYGFNVLSTTSYQIVTASGTYPSTGNSFLAAGTAATINLPSGVTISSSSNPIYFNSSGYPVNASGTQLATQTVTITAGGRSNTLNICTVSGFVTTGSCS